MSNETDKMNYCCDCGWAIRKGFIFKKWYCTCPEIMEKLKKVEISPVNGIKTIEKEKKIECTNLRGTFAYSHLERMPDGRKLCKNYKEKFEGWSYSRFGWRIPPMPPCPPRRIPNPIPPLQGRTERTTQEHDAVYMDDFSDKVFVSTSENGKESPRINGVPMENFVTRLHQKAKEFQAENRKLRGLITEIREFLIGGAIPGKVHLKQEYIREIYTIANEEDKNRRDEK